jgi:hypothetical protein
MGATMRIDRFGNINLQSNRLGEIALSLGLAVLVMVLTPALGLVLLLVD